MDTVRVRFAPSPTGPLHLGGVRTALYNYLFAKKNKGQFILRIEDTDQTRFVPGAEEYIMNSLKWAGLTLDEGIQEGGNYGPYRQSDRKHLYKQYADILLQNENAYMAFDTPEELEQMRENYKAQGVQNASYNAITRQYMKNSLSLPQEEVQKRLAENQPYVVRIKVPRNEEIKINDRIRGWVIFHSAQLDDKVIFKSDGMPTYHLANVVDDYLMKITHVIRGEEWLPSTPTHVLLYRYLGWEEQMPQFAHLPLILKPDGNGKLSKRDGDRLGFPVFPLNWTNPETKEESTGFKERGFLPEAFVNLLALLGWHPNGNQELFSMEDLIEQFSVERIGKAGAKFDFEKAKWINQQYLKNVPTTELLQEAKKLLAHRQVCDSYLEQFVGLFKDRIQFTAELATIGVYLFEKPTEYDQKVWAKKYVNNIPTVLHEVTQELQQLQDFSATEIETLIKNKLTEHQLKIPDLLPVIRIVITGEAGGPPLFELMAILGKEEVLERLQQLPNIN